MGKGQRPLPVGHVRQHPLHQVHRCDMGPLRVTGGAHPSPLAREGDEKLVLATLAAHPCEAVRQHPALQVPGEVPLHIPGQAAPHLVRLRQQRGQVVPHRLVEHRPLRLPSPVRPPVRPHLPLPSHTSPGHTLPSASHGSSWSPCLLLRGRGLREQKVQEGRSPRRVALLQGLQRRRDVPCYIATAGPRWSALNTARRGAGGGVTGRNSYENCSRPLCSALAGSLRRRVRFPPPPLHCRVRTPRRPSPTRGANPARRLAATGPEPAGSWQRQFSKLTQTGAVPPRRCADWRSATAEDDYGCAPGWRGMSSSKSSSTKHHTQSSPG